MRFCHCNLTVKKKAINLFSKKYSNDFFLIHLLHTNFRSALIYFLFMNELFSFRLMKRSQFINSRHKLYRSLIKKYFNIEYLKEMKMLETLKSDSVTVGSSWIARLIQGYQDNIWFICFTFSRRKLKEK